MASSDEIARFVRDALVAGRSRTEIRRALGDAGWSESEVNRALAGYADVEFVPPVPQPRPQLTARDTFLYAILFTALAFTAFNLVNLLHGVIDLTVPDATERSSVASSAHHRIRRAIAKLIVAAPVYIAMTVFAERHEGETSRRDRSLVRKWVTYIALFFSALTFFADLAYVIDKFLNGEITIRFLLKALVVAAVAGAIFSFYLRDVEASQPRARRFLIGVAVVVVGAIVAGLTGGSVPSQARQDRFDGMRYRSLKFIASHLTCDPTNTEERVLPKVLSTSTLRRHCNGAYVSDDYLKDPETGLPYAYRRKSDTEFSVCAKFYDARKVLSRSPFPLRNDFAFDPESGCINGRMGVKP